MGVWFWLVGVLFLSGCAKDDTLGPPASSRLSGKDDSLEAGAHRINPASNLSELNRYADDLSAVSKRQEIKELPGEWGQMIALVQGEMQGRQWKEAAEHLAIAEKLAPTSSSLIMTRSLYATLEAKQGHYDAALARLDGLMGSHLAQQDPNSRQAVEIMRATIEHYRMTGKRMP